jgi:hypothetical protein
MLHCDFKRNHVCTINSNWPDYPVDVFIFYYFKICFSIKPILLSKLRVFCNLRATSSTHPIVSTDRPNNSYSSAWIMNSSLVYSVPSVLQFDAIQHEMPAACWSKIRKFIHSHITSTEAQWVNSVWILGLSSLEIWWNVIWRVVTNFPKEHLREPSRQISCRIR